MSLRMSLRARMAVLYAVLFLIAGGGLLALSYGLLANRLPRTGNTVSTTELPASVQRAVGGLPGLQKLCAAQQSGRVFHAHPFTGCKQDVVEAARIGSQTQRDQTLHTMLEVALIGLAIATLGSGVLGWVVSARVLKPTEAALASRQRFIANAAHELRTPLSAMRTALDVTLSKTDPPPTNDQLKAMAGRVSHSVDQATATVEALLTLASTEITPSERIAVDLATAAEDALDTAAHQIEQRGLTLDATLQPARTTGDRVLIERLVGNLVDNAVRHNLDGGTIAINTSERDGVAELTIGNTGPSVDPALIPKLFEPFARAERVNNGATGGVGLGLSIAQAIANAHGATLTAQPRPDGGLEVTAGFPRQSPPRNSGSY